MTGSAQTDVAMGSRVPCSFSSSNVTGSGFHVRFLFFFCYCSLVPPNAKLSEKLRNGHGSHSFNKLICNKSIFLCWLLFDNLNLRLEIVSLDISVLLPPSPIYRRRKRGSYLSLKRCNWKKYLGQTLLVIPYEMIIIRKMLR